MKKLLPMIYSLRHEQGSHICKIYMDNIVKFSFIEENSTEKIVS